MNRLSSQAIAWRAAQDIPDGAYVNLGIGMPEKVADHLPEGREIIFHSENGILGMGPTPPADEADPELINAGKKPVTLLVGGSFFHHADSFAMVRGGHIDICILGAFEVSAQGDLANWSTGAAGPAPAVGGAMDLAQGAKAIYVLMTHTTRAGEPKILKRCRLPLTGKGVVRRIYTDLAVIEPTPDGLMVLETVEGCSFEALQALTEAELTLSPEHRTLVPPVALRG